MPLKVINHPMMKALMNTFPDVEDSVWQLRMYNPFVIFNAILYTIPCKIIEKSSDGLTTSGFEKLEKGSPIYL
jgi:hypothetical protein